MKHTVYKRTQYVRSYTSLLALYFMQTTSANSFLFCRILLSDLRTHVHSKTNYTILAACSLLLALLLLANDDVIDVETVTSSPPTVVLISLQQHRLQQLQHARPTILNKRKAKLQYKIQMGNCFSNFSFNPGVSRPI